MRRARNTAIADSVRVGSRESDEGRVRQDSPGDAGVVPTSASRLVPPTSDLRPPTLRLHPPVLRIPGRVLPGVDGVAMHPVGIDAPLAELEDGEGRDVLPVRLGHL